MYRFTTSPQQLKFSFIFMPDQLTMMITLISSLDKAYIIRNTLTDTHTLTYDMTQTGYTTIVKP